MKDLVENKLKERVKREKKAYDEGTVWEESDRLHKRFWHVFSCPNSLYLEEYFESIIAQETPHSVVLDYGCFYGDLYKTLSKYNPKKVVGIDISERAIEVAREKYGKFADYYVMDAHKLEFENSTFDFIVGRAILHHLDWNTAIMEIHRVLKVGGVAIFIEPLGDNPFAKIFRFLTPKARTKDESPVSRKQIKYADSIMGRSYHRFANLFSVPVAMVTSQFSKNPQNFLLQVTHYIDLVISKTPMKYWMRIVALVWKKV